MHYTTEFNGRRVRITPMIRFREIKGMPLLEQALDPEPTEADPKPQLIWMVVPFVKLEPESPIIKPSSSLKLI